MLEVYAHIQPVWELLRITIIFAADNGVLVALLARDLPPAQRKRLIFAGIAIAISLRIFLYFFVFSYIFELPWWKLISALLLLHMCVRFIVYLRPAMEGESDEVTQNITFRRALRTIIATDCILAFGNIAAIYGAHPAPPSSAIPLLSDPDTFRLIGLLMAVFAIGIGSSVVNAILRRFPRLITGVALFLGWIAGELILNDPVMLPYVEHLSAYFGIAVRPLQLITCTLSLFTVWGTGYLLQKRRALERYQREVGI